MRLWSLLKSDPRRLLTPSVAGLFDNMIVDSEVTLGLNTPRQTCFLCLHLTKVDLVRQDKTRTEHDNLG